MKCLESKIIPSGYGAIVNKVRVKGLAGAFVLGLTYGVLSGSCTFGFIASILAIRIIQSKIMIGVIFIILFGIGHCIPIAVTGSSTALVKRFFSKQCMA